MTALTDALDVVSHYFGHQHQITAERQVLDSVPFDDFDPAERARLSPIVGVLRNTPVLVLDLHGDRANDAEEQLEALRLPIVVVYHGKGSGVLADVVDEFVERDGRYVVGGRSGATLADRRHGMTLLVERGLAGRVLAETRARPDRSVVAVASLSFAFVALVTLWSTKVAALLAVAIFLFALVAFAPRKQKRKRRRGRRDISVRRER